MIDQAVQIEGEYDERYPANNGVPRSPSTWSRENPAARRRPLDFEMFRPTGMEKKIKRIREATAAWSDMGASNRRSTWAEKRPTDRQLEMTTRGAKKNAYATSPSVGTLGIGRTRVSRGPNGQLDITKD